MKKILIIIFISIFVMGCNNTDKLNTNQVINGDGIDEKFVEKIINDELSVDEVKEIETVLNYDGIEVEKRSLDEDYYVLTINNKIELTVPTEIVKMTSEELESRYGSVKPPIAYTNFKGIEFSFMYDNMPLKESEIQEMLDFYEKSYTEAYSSDFHLVNSELKEINGTTFGELEFDLELEGENLRSKFIISSIDGNYFAISFNTQLEKLAVNESTVSKIINSIAVK